MWDFKIRSLDKPRYLEIAEALERDIVSGEIPPGRRLMTHRALAQAAGVTVSTATRAYSEMEKRGLIKTMVGKGTFVTATKPTSILQNSETSSIIELGVAMPLFSEEPSVKPVLQKIIQEEDVDALVKCFSPLGYAHHREIGAEWLGRTGVNVTADSLLITAGHQHALFSIFYALFMLGDKIAVDQLTNPGFKMLALQAGFELKGVMMDADGMMPEELDALCQTNSVRGIYITGGIQNPSANPIPAQRREALAKVIKKHDLLLVEDDSFNMRDIRKDPCITALIPGNSIYLSSFSSALYSGLRVAFVHAPPKFHSRLALAIVENIWTVPPLCVALACACIADGTAERAFKQKQRELARRVNLLREVLSEFEVSCSEQAIYAWIRLPDSWDSKDFEYMAEKNGVRVFAADKLAVVGTVVPNYIRLAITGPPDLSTFKKGLEILASLLKKEGGVINPIW